MSGVRQMCINSTSCYFYYKHIIDFNHQKMRYSKLTHILSRTVWWTIIEAADSCREATAHQSPDASGTQSHRRKWIQCGSTSESGLRFLLKNVFMLCKRFL